LFGILARDKPVGVLLRRGPKGWVQLIRWNTANDTFEPGQWFHGRIYERRCDLSPSGDLFVYFASKHTGRQLASDYTYAWTAVSRPPYFTALTLWPKGDCWDGGGYFEADRRLHLNHAGAAESHPDHPTHKKLRVTTNSCGRGEDLPIYNDILQSKGWSRADPKKNLWTEAGPKGLVLRMELEDIDFTKPGGPYHFGFLLMRESDGEWLHVLDAQWADWDHAGRLVYAQDGKLFAAEPDDKGAGATELADFGSSEPEEVLPPAKAKHWPRW
jgi:hypothetical protein